MNDIGEVSKSHPASDAGSTAVAETVNASLERFGTELAAVAGDSLVSLVLYGGVATSEYLPGTSDVNVMAVFTTVDVPLLDRMANVVTQAQREFGLALMILDEQDIPTCAEVFPIKFRNIQRHHRMLRGKEVLGQFEITRERLKRQCTRQIQNMQLRLRQFYLQRSHWPERIEDTLEDGHGGPPFPDLFRRGHCGDLFHHLVLAALPRLHPPSSPDSSSNKSGSLRDRLPARGRE